MNWNLTEAIEYYRRQGAPGDQNALRNLLAEVQAESGGAIPGYLLDEIARELGTKASFLAAIIRRIPRLRLSDLHTLELCAGPNCGKAAALAAAAEKLAAAHPGKISLKYVPCMRMCGKGPNLKWDGTLHHKADETLLVQLIKTAQ